MFISKEKRAYWLFLLWVLILPVVHQPGLLAQDDDMFIAEDASADAVEPSDQSLPDEAASVDDDENAFFDTAGEDAGFGDQEADVEGELALSADPHELLAKVNGPARAGKHNEVISVLQEHEDAVGASSELLSIYVEALINSDKTDWSHANHMARQLANKDPSSGLAYYVQGMYYQNSKKPDIGKALTFLGKAKAAKKPYAAAGTAYYIVLAKKYGVIALALIVLPIIVVVKKRKAKKAAEISFDSLPDQNLEPSAEDLVGKEGEAVEAAADQPEPSDKKAELKKKIKTRDKTSKAKTVVSSENSEAAIVLPEEGASDEPRKVSEPPVMAERAAPIQAVAPEPVVSVSAPAIAEPVVPAADVDASLPLTDPPSAAVYQTITSKHQAEIEELHELIRPGRRAPVQADPELDTLWSELSRKAMQSKIAPQFRQEEPAVGVYRPGSARSSSAPSAGYPEPMAPEVDFNVSMDLSEEALKDDLTVKLKMMAITDAELREMFAQKNSRHIPHLIEYVLTRPEPVRLAFVARELGNYDDPAVIDILAGLLYHDDQRVSLAAIQGLEQSKKVTAILHLSPFLRSEIPLLAQAARTALNNFGAVKIMQAFHNLPQNSDERIRLAGVFVLSRMKGPQVEELLKQMLRDDSLDVRCDVILAMSYQKSPAYLDSLREFFRIAADRDKTLARKAIVYLQGFVTRKR